LTYIDKADNITKEVYELEKIFTTNEAREFLKVSDATIRRYIKSGKLKSQKLGREYRITETAIKEFLDEQAKKGGIPSV
jgi:excisionase family DNA binding protein